MPVSTQTTCRVFSVLFYYYEYCCCEGAVLNIQCCQKFHPFLHNNNNNTTIAFSDTRGRKLNPCCARRVGKTTSYSLLENNLLGASVLRSTYYMLLFIFNFSTGGGHHHHHQTAFASLKTSNFLKFFEIFQLSGAPAVLYRGTTLSVHYSSCPAQSRLR